MNNKINNSLLRSISNLKSLWNTARPNSKPYWESRFDEDNVLHRLGQIFCLGPYYFYIFDFTSFAIQRLSPDISTVVDTNIKESEYSFEAFMAAMHPEDLSHFQTCETMVNKFLFEHVNSLEILNYKVAYFFRLRKPTGLYHIFHHQTIALSLDRDRRVHTVLGIHTDVNHLFKNRPDNLSFIHLEGGESYLEVNPYDPSLDRADIILPMLSSRERQVLELLSQGANDTEVASQLSISRNTTRTHRENIRTKLNAKNTTHAVTIALKKGLI